MEVACLIRMHMVNKCHDSCCGCVSLVHVSSYGFVLERGGEFKSYILFVNVLSI